MKNTSRTKTLNNYLRRVNKIQDYIEENLYSTLTLSELADIANFSKYHFHRIFSAITGETVQEYVNRIKLERSAAFLITRLDFSITDVAYLFGFTDSSVFSRAFRNYYGKSPKEFRKQISKNCKDSSKSTVYDPCKLDKLQQTATNGENMKILGVQTVTVEKLKVIYIRFTGTYDAFRKAYAGMLQKLYQYAMKNNLLVSGKSRVLTFYHDNPVITDDEKLRSSVCLTVSRDLDLSDSSQIGSLEITGKYAVGHFELFLKDEGLAWEYMYGIWLPNSRYEPANTFPFTEYVSDPGLNPLGKQLFDIYLPIELGRK